MKTELIKNFLKEHHLQGQKSNYDNIIQIEYYTKRRDIDLPNFELSKKEYITLVLKKIKHRIGLFYDKYSELITKEVLRVMARVITRRTLNYIADNIFKKEKKKRVSKGGEVDLEKYQKQINSISNEIIKFINHTKNIIKK